MLHDQRHYSDADIAYSIASYVFYQPHDFFTIADLSTIGREIRRVYVK